MLVSHLSYRPSYACLVKKIISGNKKVKILYEIDVDDLFFESIKFILFSC